jgi:cytochrome P450
MADPIQFPTTKPNLFDPPEELDDLRESVPVCPLRYLNGESGWLVTSHALGKAVLTDPRFGRGSRFGRDHGRGRFAVGNFERSDQLMHLLEERYDGWRPLEASFVQMDPPEHGRYRKMVAAHYSMRHITEARADVEEIVRERLDAMEDAGPPGDLLTLFIRPVTLASQCALLGLEVSDAERFFLINTIMTDPRWPIEDAATEQRAVYELMERLAEERRREPRDDVITAVAQLPGLSTGEIADMLLTLLLAGFETTGDQFGWATFVLLTHTDKLDELRSDYSLLETGVEELLRYGAIFPMTARVAHEDVELEGQLIRAGDTVTVAIAGANRDPDKYECPHELDLARTASSHLTFSQGVHMCIGQHQVRSIMKTGLRGLFERFPALRLAVPLHEIPVYPLERGTLGLYELPVTW